MSNTNESINLDIEETSSIIHSDQVMRYLKILSDICRDKKWYASSVYAARAAESISEMSILGDKAQKPTQYIHLVDVHYSAYPDELD